jgi:hypothetical protein
MHTEWVLSPDEYAATADRVAKINARATKRGFAGRIELAGVQQEVTETDRYGLKRTRMVIDVEISGEAPCYSGWAFLAAVDTVDTQDGADFITRLAPGVNETDIDRSLLAAGQCQHCNAARPNRRRTFLVRNTETGQLFQVGTTCLKDFLGWEGRPVFIDEDAVAREIEPDFQGGRRLDYVPATVVAAAWAAVKTFGWAPASRAGLTTRDVVSAILYGTTKADRDLAEQIAPLLPEGVAKASEIIATILANFSTESEYEANMRVALRLAAVGARQMGLVVSAVAAYERILGLELRRKIQREAAAVSEYAGEVSQKLTVTGTITHLASFESNYGYTPTRNLLIILESGTTVAKIITAAGWAFDVERGQEITVTGTVKAHKEYKGTKQTVLTRARPTTP